MPTGRHALRFRSEDRRAFQLSAGDQPGAGSGNAPGGFDHAVETVLKNEGGYNPSDMNGQPVNFGINQGANPGVDVRNLTREQAKQIYHDKYWVPSGAENLPANLQTPYFDVYIRNPAEAKKALDQSGGDPAKFMQISNNYFQSLARKPNGQKYAHAWAVRDANNLAIATGGGNGGSVPISGKPLASDASADETAKFIGGQVALGSADAAAGHGQGSRCHAPRHPRRSDEAVEGDGHFSRAKRMSSRQRTSPASPNSPRSRR
jgi:hypothetical protein